MPGAAPERAPLATVIPMELQAVVELLADRAAASAVERMAERVGREQIAPLRATVDGLRDDVAALKQAVLEEGGVLRQVNALRRECSAEHQQLHVRISNVRHGHGAGGLDPEAKANLTFRERLKGAYHAFGAVAGVLMFAAYIYEKVFRK